MLVYNNTVIWPQNIVSYIVWLYIMAYTSYNQLYMYDLWITALHEELKDV